MTSISEETLNKMYKIYKERCEFELKNEVPGTYNDGYLNGYINAFRFWLETLGKKDI